MGVEESNRGRARQFSLLRLFIFQFALAPLLLTPIVATSQGYSTLTGNSSPWLVVLTAIVPPVVYIVLMLLVWPLRNRIRSSAADPDGTLETGPLPTQEGDAEPAGLQQAVTPQAPAERPGSPAGALESTAARPQRSRFAFGGGAFWGLIVTGAGWGLLYAFLAFGPAALLHGYDSTITCKSAGMSTMTVLTTMIGSLKDYVALGAFMLLNFGVLGATVGAVYGLFTPRRELVA